jgi:hypothetical protein
MTRLKVAGLALAFIAALPIAALAQADITGVWEVNIDSPQGPMTIDATFKQEGEAVAGLITSPMGSVELKGTLVKEALSFNYTVPLQGQNLEIAMAGKVAGDSMTGTVTIVGMGEVPWTAKRKPAIAAPTTASTTTGSTTTTTATTTAPPVGAADSTTAAGGAGGTWDISLNIDGVGEFPMTANLTQTAEKVSGTFSGQGGEIPVSGTMTGTALQLEFTAPTPQGEIPVTMTGELGPNGFTGKADLGGVGAATWTGTRAKP